MELSYRMRIKHYRTIFRDTLKIYRAALKYIINVCDKEWDIIKDLTGKEQINQIEHLIHKTEDNPIVKYDFDKKFYKFPSYFRRTAIQDALGSVSSYKSNLINWEKERKGRRPFLKVSQNKFPCFYKGNMYKKLDDYKAQIKVYHKNDWVWLTIEFKKSDVDYIKRNYSDWNQSNPTLELNGKIWSLRFLYKKDIGLSKTKLKEQIVVGVDLNTINHNAVCSAIKYDGTVLSRKFINFGKEKDHLNNCIKHKNEAIKLNQPKQNYKDELFLYNYNKTPRLWRFINYANKEIAVLTARAIVEYVKSVNADVIVFEHLDTNSKKRFLKEKLHLWCAKTIQEITTSLAHKNGIHVNRIFANGTSKYAFDGSGEVKRGKQASPDYPYNVCVFTTGKIYNSDLNASYNIAARYFIKEIEKAKPKKFMAAKAKDPSLAKRSTCTLDTLIRLAKVA